MEIVVLLLLILLNGLFAMAEIALVSARKTRLESAARKGKRAAQRAIDLSDHPFRFLSAVQIGITLIGILTGMYSSAKIQDDLAAWIAQFAEVAHYADSIATVIIVVVVTYFSMVLGELVPKRIGMNMPDKVAMIVALPMHWVSVIASPFIWLLSKSSNTIIRLLGLHVPHGNNVTEEEIKAIIQEGTESGEVDTIEQDIVERVFSMGDRKVGSLMTHRSDLVTLSTHMTPETIRAVVIENMHSIYPVFADGKDLQGIVLLKDLFKHLTDEDFRLSNHVVAANFVPEYLSAYEALRQFKGSHTHQALVVDEFGELQGLITLNDMLEALVGDAADFYGQDFTFLQRADGSWLVDGQYPFPDFLRRFDLDELATAYPYNTISGLILHELRSIPKAGDTLQWMDFQIEIMDMDGARIDKILVTENGGDR